MSLQSFSDRLARDAMLDIEGMNVICRVSDGYINATQLCKAGDRKYSTWKRSKVADIFINILSTSLNISKDELIKSSRVGLNETRCTWVHPRVALNIAQWISPKFDVLVGNWIDSLKQTINTQSTYIDYLLHRLESIEHQSELHSQITQLNKELEDTRCKLIELEKRQGILLQGVIYTVKDRDELYLHEEKAIIKAREIHGIDKVMNKMLPKRKCNNNRNV